MGFLRWIRKAQNALHKRAESIRREEERDRRQTMPIDEPVKVSAVVSFDNKTTADATAENSRNHATQEGIRRATRNAFVAASIYAFITILMWRQMNKQTEIASTVLRQSTESFRIDERAWLEIQPMSPTLYSPRNIKFPAVFSYEIYLKNLGKTEARDVHLRFSPNVQGSIEKGDEPSFAEFEQEKLLLGKVPSASGIPIFNPIPAVLAPGELPTAPLLWHGQEPTEGQWVDYFIGRVDYIDAFGVNHWHKFCMFPGDAKGNLWHCKYGNDEDHNQELPTN
jgi:hypothetical protein